MGVYQLGVPINIVQEFFAVDPLTEVSTPADPTTVTFTVQAPDGTETVYVSGIDPEVSNPQVGVYVLTLDPPTPPGNWLWRAEGTGAVVAADEGTFDVLESGVLTPTIDQPTLGPCSSWIAGDDVAACADAAVGSSDYLLDTVAYEASMALYEISGRIFTGLCTKKVRPCADPCSCFGYAPSYGGAWYWGNWGASGWAWRNESCGDTCGCGSLSRVKLSGYPVREIVEVKIDGTVLAAVDPTGGWPTYRLDQWRYLTRMADPGPPVKQLAWPSCQNLALSDNQPGTFSITYRHGVEPPQLGRDAAAQLAWQIWLSCPGNSEAGDCVLPSGVTRIDRQGISVERSLLTAWFDPSQPSGMPAVDLFLRSYWRTRVGRRPAVWSPDVQRFARREGAL